MDAVNPRAPNGTKVFWGAFMANWFYASEGKQQGPYPDGQFRDLVAQGVVRPDTLVWSEGMAGWQKAAEIPGLIGGAGAPPMMPPVGRR